MPPLMSLTVAALWLHEVVGGVFAHTLPPSFEAMKAQTQLFANSHPSFTVNLFQVSHDVSACSPLHTKHCSLAPEFA